MSEINFIEINPNKDIEDLIKKYEDDADAKLYPAQDPTILIKTIAYYGSLIKSQFNDAAKLNLVEHSRAPFLDFLGAMKQCYRNKKQQGECDFKIKLKETFSYELTLSKGFQIKTKDGLYIFETIEDYIIQANESEITVKMYCTQATADANKYSPGEINVIVSSGYSYIESAENITNVVNGADDEEDESYIKRILLAPEGFSVAGPELAYIYFTLSADSSIVDVSVDCPEDDITVTLNNETTVIKENTKETDNFNIEVNYQTGEVELILKQNLNTGEVIKIKVPHPYEIILYLLTKDGIVSESLIEKTNESLKSVRPLSDYVNIKAASIEDFEISGVVYVENDVNDEEFEKIKTRVNEVLNAYLDTFKNVLKRAVIKKRIENMVCSVDKVYDFELTSIEQNLSAKKDVSYNGKIGTLTFKRIENEE